MLAKSQLSKARETGNIKSAQQAQERLEDIAKRLPAATPVNLGKYAEKARALGLDPSAIRISEDRIIAAPKRGYDQPVFMHEVPVRRDISIIPTPTSQAIRMNELFSSRANPVE